MLTKSVFLFPLLFVVSSGHAAVTDPRACISQLVASGLVSDRLVIDTYKSVVRPQAVLDLARLVAIETVSQPGPHQSSPTQMLKGAQAVAGLLTSSGIENVRIENFGSHNPIVTGDWLRAGPEHPTILFYGHYDVVSAEADLWQSPPFTLTERGGRYFGRGAADNKGGLSAFFAAIRSIMQTHGYLPLNVKFIIEGDEEADQDLNPFLVANADRWRADAVFVVDSINPRPPLLSVTTAIRGYLSYDLKFSSGTGPVHGGIWGGKIPHPLKALVRALASLEDDQQLLSFAGLQEMIPKIQDPDLSATNAELASQVGLLPGVQMIGGETNMATTRLPFLSYNELTSNAGGSGGLPSSAQTNLTVRTVPGMEEPEFTRLLRAALERANPLGLHIELQNTYAGEGFRTPSSDPLLQLLVANLTAASGQPATFEEVGGSLSIISKLKKVAGARSVNLYGVADGGDSDSKIHGHDENLSAATFDALVIGTIHTLMACGTPSFRNLFSLVPTGD